MSTTESSEAADRARRLQRVAELLAEAVTPQEVLDSILTEGVKAAEARAGAIGVLSEDGTTVELLAQRGYDASAMTGWTSFPLEAQVPMSDVIRTGEALFLASVQERNERYPALSDQGQDGHALVVVPLAVEGRVFGAMSLSFDRDVFFEPDRREMKLTLARQAAQALARSRLYAAEQALRQRMTFLAEASELLASSLDYNHTLGQVAKLSVPGLADWCTVDVVGPDGEVERLAVAHRGPRQGPLGLRAAGALPARPRCAHRRHPCPAHGRARVLPVHPRESAGRGDRRRRGAAPNRGRARAEVHDLRAPDRARSDARRANA